MNTPLRTHHIARRARGFTLVELMAVLAIAAILAGAAVPSMRGLIRSVRLTSATNDLFASLMLARNEAAKRNARVAMCKSVDGVRCEPTGGWEQGWIVFHDTNNNGVRDADETVLHRAQAMSPELRLDGNLNVAKYVSYAPGGLTKLVGGGFQAGTITLCNESTKPGEARLIVLSSAGRPRVQKTTVSSCA